MDLQENNLTPEALELRKKEEELAFLEAELAQKELDFATLQAEIDAFEMRYLRRIGVLISKLDEIEAQIADYLLLLNPKNHKIKEKAKDAHAQAKKTSEEAQKIKDGTESLEAFSPSNEIKSLYRTIAKQIHPDLANDEEDREVRNKLMTELNAAYKSNNLSLLKEIQKDWENKPEGVKGEGVGAELVRVIRKIVQVQERIENIVVIENQIYSTDIYQMKTKVEKAIEIGQDLLLDMENNINQRIIERQSNLLELQEQYNNPSRIK